MSATLAPFDASQVKVLLLEGLNEAGVNILKKAGYQVECHSKALSEEKLREKIKDVHAIGIRSKTQLTAEILKEAQKLLVIGCFCIGTNQVDLTYAANKGIAVFNSPFSNSRSVAELVLGEIIALSRKVGDKNRELHSQVWNRKVGVCHEIRGKVLGIIGYGHIGSQLSVLADSMGMVIIFYDILQIMPLGTAKPVATLEELLQRADFVTLHVPELEGTKNMIGAREIGLMKKGSFFINAARGSVVDINAVADALRSGHLAGAAVDVFPEEPFANGPGFECALQGCPNTILTPHIGGSTQEAQTAIGVEVATALVKYINTGSTIGAVNFPEEDLRVPAPKTIRILNCHQNVPGVLKQVNRNLSDFNIDKQICDSKGTIAYLMADVRGEAPQQEVESLYRNMCSMPENIVTRILY